MQNFQKTIRLIMLLLNRTQPKKSLYVIGACLIEKLRETAGPFHAVELFEAYGEDLSVSFPQFLLTLDWLFMAGLISLSNDGRLQKCF